jgi:hypothetical protein
VVDCKEGGRLWPQSRKTVVGIEMLHIVIFSYWY